MSFVCTSAYLVNSICSWIRDDTEIRLPSVLLGRTATPFNYWFFSIALGSGSYKPHLPHGAKSAFIMPLRTPQGHRFTNLFLASWSMLNHVAWVIWICPCYAVSHKQIRFLEWRSSDLGSDLWMVFSHSLWNSLSGTKIPYISIWMDVYWLFTPQWHTHRSVSHSTALNDISQGTLSG